MSRGRPNLNPSPGTNILWVSGKIQYDIGYDSPFTVTFVSVEFCNIYLRTKNISDGTPVNRYSSGWANILIPKTSYISILELVQFKTGYHIVDANTAVETKDRRYVKTAISMA